MQRSRVKDSQGIKRIFRLRRSGHTSRNKYIDNRVREWLGEHWWMCRWYCESVFWKFCETWSTSRITGSPRQGRGVGLEADDALSHTAEKPEFLFVSLRPRSYWSVKSVVNVKWLEGDERVTMRRIGCPRWVGAGKDVRWKRKW